MRHSTLNLTLALFPSSLRLRKHAVDLLNVTSKIHQNIIMQILGIESHDHVNQMLINLCFSSFDNYIPDYSG